MHCLLSVPVNLRTLQSYCSVQNFFANIIATKQTIRFLATLIKTMNVVLLYFLILHANIFFKFPVGKNKLHLVGKENFHENN